MKFIHTFWSVPSFGDRWNIKALEQIIKNIWYYSLSVAYIKHLGLNIDIHTDSFGEKCLNHLPYSNIHLTLDTIPEYIKPYQWAYGKFWALKDCDLDTIHIDGDVFIKKIECIHKLRQYLNSNCDAIVQYKEHHKKSLGVLPVYTQTTEELSSLKYPEWGIRGGKYAYNTGIIMFRNQKFKDEFLNEYFRCHYDCATIEELINQRSICRSKGYDFVPDLIIEQQFIFDLSNHKKYKVLQLIDYLHPRESANVIGYQHIIGAKKYDNSNIKNCIETLKQINYNIYLKTVQKCKEIHDHYNKKIKFLYE